MEKRDFGTDKEAALARAKEREKATLTEKGECSKCGKPNAGNNFCTECGATFMTPEEIEKLEQTG